MSRLFLFLFLAFLSFENFGQDTVNQSDASGKKQGYWRKVDSSGGKVYEGHFRSGFPYGEFRYYYPGGKQKAVSVVSDSGRFSRTVSYFKNGWKMAEGNYWKEKKDSLWRFYSEIDGKLVSEEFYKDGKKNGISKTYYPGEGVVAETVTWKDGVKEGPWKEFYSDGNLKINGTYKAGEKEGTFKAFYESGNLMLIGWYTNGHTQGTWNYFTPKGTIQKMETYKDGVLIKSQEMDTGKK